MRSRQSQDLMNHTNLNTIVIKQDLTTEAMHGFSRDIYFLTQSIKVILSILVVLAIISFESVNCSADSFVDGIRDAKAGKLDRAVEAWTRVIRRNPRSYEAYMNRGSANMCSGYVFRGIIDWSIARELSPLFAYAVFTGDFIRQTSRKSPFLNYAVSVELDPDYIGSVLMMGVTYLDLGLTVMTADLYTKSADLTRNPLLKSQLDYWAKSLGPESQRHENVKERGLIENSP